MFEQRRETGLSDLAWDHLWEPQKCVGEKYYLFADCAPEFGLRELTGDKLYRPFALIGVRHD